MSPKTLSSSLSALKTTGSVFGVFLSNGDRVLFQDAPFSEARIAELATTLDDIALYFVQENRSPDQLSFGFDGGNLLVFIEGEHRLAVFFHHAGEVDLLAEFARSFMKDFVSSVLIEDFQAMGVSRAQDRTNGNTARIAAQAKAPIDPTSPIQPIQPIR
ncbi:hypothetical protein N9B73_10770 [Verrucomicrobiales bacterium]|jgi:hypothetical protein|nr:hypothetical protein [Verrucomicrobiales bacterium]